METAGSSFQQIEDKYFAVLSECRICPRNCGVNRLVGKKGVCGSDASFNISSICIHKGEEPAISGENGICNIFFSRCNLSCLYCQNWQISCSRGEVPQKAMTLEAVTASVISLLDKGCKSVGFVSPSHNIPHVKSIIDALRAMGRNPVFVYNTNCYDKVDEIRQLEDYIGVFLPDFKYADGKKGKEYSGVHDYPEIALSALKEMFRQKGSTLHLDDYGLVEKGLIIRHLILPGNIEDSRQVLNLIASQLSESVAISLMSQYWPTSAVERHAQLGRRLTREEYEIVVNEMEKLGFYKGWVQELESHENYRPDFLKIHPFEGD
jgi:putative pyruvate formate lyase activating enzyme